MTLKYCTKSRDQAILGVFNLKNQTIWLVERIFKPKNQTIKLFESIYCFHGFLPIWKIMKIV